VNRVLLWVGDAVCDSGFAKCTHETIEGFSAQGWSVVILGLNYRGDPHPYPYRIFPAYVPGGDLFGVRRLLEIVGKVRPEVIVFQNDPWNIPRYMEQIQQLKDVPTLIGAIAIDGKNAQGWALNGLDHTIFWTKFAEQEARKGGYNKTSSVVPLGVDLNIYKPGPRREARVALGLPDFMMDGFIVLNMNRNQPRKRLDLTMEAFAEFYHTHVPDGNAFLYMHVCPTGDLGYDLDQLTAYYGLRKHVAVAAPGVYEGSSEADVVLTYQAADVQMSTTQGEGWGLTTMEGMACGIPQVVPAWSALGEWATSGAVMIPCLTTSVTPNKTNTIGGVPDKALLVNALHQLYIDHVHRRTIANAGLELVARPEYRWEHIARSFADEVEVAHTRKRLGL
jgi:D-inositol-3-phosphate glycosyltransferase